ncbi:hypothetical protein PACTADRAFT_81496 [Pachysolen tannophilus NRRL Y-2460]|uniref:Transcription factor CBF/NF-Y/archaeal histone domain-containing protein n=1 Tax=Pachysolen tannophilus NRRL Y-2460 TaxID=669874 RepID=A0A1E4TT66_PACTA|nr:hypothetical protein PACTADRAFT_81496 [Pachysolen tannophilus NRRL Y-2460]
MNVQRFFLDMSDNSSIPSLSYHETELREQERWLPIANVARLMKNTLPGTAKVSKDAKECMQECVSEFISFITSEASDKCVNEKRKTINGEDVLYSMHSLGFENYAEVLKIYLAKYREQQALKQERGETTSTRKSPTAAQLKRQAKLAEEARRESVEEVEEGKEINGSQDQFINNHTTNADEFIQAEDEDDEDDEDQGQNRDNSNTSTSNNLSEVAVEDQFLQQPDEEEPTTNVVSDATNGLEMQHDLEQELSIKQEDGFNALDYTHDPANNGNEPDQDLLYQYENEF